MLKTNRYINLLVLLFFANNLFSQPIINERFIINDTELSIFGSVIATDSCYYATGIFTSSPEYTDTKSMLTRFNLDGTIHSVYLFENDTIGIDLWQKNNLLQTSDGNFVQIGYGYPEMSGNTHYFLRFKPNGDTIATNIIDDFWLEDKHPSKPTSLIETYNGFKTALNFQRRDDGRVGISYTVLDSLGNIIHRLDFYTEEASYARLRLSSLLQYESNKLIIGTNILNTSGDNVDVRMHTKLIVIDTLGNLLDEHIYWDDRLSYTCNGLTKTIDGGLLYCGINGIYYEETRALRFKGRIVKLTNEFEVEWEINLGEYTSSFIVSLNEIKQLNDYEFVAVGSGQGESVRSGWLVKFNLDGEVIWHRKYFKVPHFEGEPNYPDQVLYDVDITTDGGFVMVGESINYEDNPFLPGQKAWLVKTDKYGCLVPDCQLGDTVLNVQETPLAVKTWIYPNPTSNTLFYYHHSNNFTPANAVIYSMAGKKVQAWQISENDITYEVDVRGFENGVYVLSIIGENGQVLSREKFVKE